MVSKIVALTKAERKWAQRWPDVLTWGLLAGLALFFLVLKSFSLHWQVGDENIYFYMAWATLDHGALPYHDYFFAHPPGHLIPGILWFALSGFGPMTARLIPVVASLVSAWFLFRLCRRRLGRVGAVAAVFLFLTAYSLLRASSHWTGINLSVMWVAIGLYYLFEKKMGIAGACMAMGVGTGNYVLPAAVMTGMLAFVSSRREGLRYLGAFAALWTAIQGLGLCLAGGEYIDAVYRDHFNKPQAAGASWKMTARVFTDNFALFLGLVLGLASTWVSRQAEASQETKDSVWQRFWAHWRRWLWQDEARGLARDGALWTCGYLVNIALLPRVFPFYFLLLFPAMAMTGGYAAKIFQSQAADLIRHWRQGSRTWRRKLAWVLLVMLVVGVAYGFRLTTQRALLPDYVRRSDRPMQWADGALPGFANALLRACCWEDRARAFAEYGTVTEILFHESQYFEQAQALASYVQEHSRPEQVIFGDSATAGLVALLSKRRLVADFADTNTLRFRSGLTSVASTIAKIDAADLAFVLVSGRPVRDSAGRSQVRYGKFASVPGFRSYLDKHFRIAYQVRDRTKGWYFLLARRKGGGTNQS